MSERVYNSNQLTNYKISESTSIREETRQYKEVIDLLESSSEEEDSDSSGDYCGYLKFVRHKENREEKIKELNNRIKELTKDKKDLEKQVHNLKEISKGVIRNIAEVLSYNPSEVTIPVNTIGKQATKKARIDSEDSQSSSVVKDLIGEI